MNEKQLIISYESFLKQDNEDKYNMLEEAVYEIERLNNRIEKAVEYIKNTPLYETICDYNMEEELEIQNVSDETASNKLLDILKGDNLNYITNLQQENNNLKTSLDESQEVVIDLQQENERLKELDENYPIEEELAEAYRREEDYKSRIEKAVEYLKERESNTEEYLKTISMSRNCYIIEQEEVIDILNGRSDE